MTTTTEEVAQLLKDWKAQQTAKGAVRFRTETLDADKGQFKVYAFDARGYTMNSLELRGLKL